MLVTYSYGSDIFRSENLLRDIIYNALLYCDMNCRREDPNLFGRSDLLIVTPQSNYVFEFKLARADSDVSVLAKQAVEQMQKRCYGTGLTGKALYRLIGVFSKKSRKLLVLQNVA